MLIEFLEFTFQSFWVWLGMVILVSSFGTAIGAVFASIHGGKK